MGKRVLTPRFAIVNQPQHRSPKKIAPPIEINSGELEQVTCFWAQNTQPLTYHVKCRMSILIREII